MVTELVVDVQSKEISYAIIEDKSLVEFQQESVNLSFSVGDIFLGRVHKVMPGLNAAFVDVGYEKDAFLHYLDLGPQFNSLNSFTKQQLSNKKKQLTLSKFNLLPEIPKDWTNCRNIKPWSGNTGSDCQRTYFDQRPQADLRDFDRRAIFDSDAFFRQNIHFDKD